MVGIHAHHLKNRIWGLALTVLVVSLLVNGAYAALDNVFLKGALQHHQPRLEGRLVVATSSCVVH